MGLFDGKIDINVWCKSKFDKFDLFLLKFTSMPNALSSIIKHQTSVLSLQSAVFRCQKLSQRIIFYVQFLFSLNKMPLKTLTKNRFAGNSKFDNFPQTRKSEHFTRNMRFLTIFAGEGG